MSFRRNLIIVVGHGLRSDVLADAQTWPAHTPNLDKLAQRGLRLIGTSACPADPGAMICLATGLHTRQHGVIHQTNTLIPQKGWPTQLKDEGYHLVGVGCVAMLEKSLDQSVCVDSVQNLRSPHCAYLASASQRGLLDEIVSQRRQRLRYGPFAPDRLELEPDDDIDGFIARQAVQVLDNMPLDRPWALLVCFSGPGNQLPPPRMYDDMSDPDELAKDFLPADFTKINALAELDYPRIELQRLTRKRIGAIRRDYLGRVSLIDHGIGLIMGATETRPDQDRVWTLVTADRGQLLGEQGLIGHRSFISPAIEVPVIITPPTPGQRGGPGASELPPDSPTGRSADDLVSTVDIVATLCAMAGADPPPNCEGRSLLPLLAQDELPGRFHGLISEFGHRLLLETERYKVIFDTEQRKPLGLFDMLNDPDENKNLLEQPVADNLLDALRWRLADTLMSLKSPNPIA